MAARLPVCGAFIAAALSVVEPEALAASNQTRGIDAVRAEAMQDRWQGRRSLFGYDHPRNRETIGERPGNARACIDEPVRLRNSDGSTAVRRLRRCD